MLDTDPTNLMLCCCGTLVHGPGAREGKEEGFVIHTDWHVWGAGKTPAYYPQLIILSHLGFYIRTLKAGRRDIVVL